MHVFMVFALLGQIVEVAEAIYILHKNCQVRESVVQ